MQAFVTGSTGLLGNNLVRGLVDAGWTVKALVRSARKGQEMPGNLPGVTLIEGDMQDIPAFADQMRGSDVLFHVAAYFREYYQPGDHWPTLEAINVKGTIKLLEAAEQVGVKKTIYVSSSGVIGAPNDGRAFSDEANPPDAFAMSNLYFRSKVLAEQAVAEFLKTHRLPVVLILPTWMWGPGDAAPTTTGRIVQDYLRGAMPAIIPGGSMTVDARDVAAAMISAVECGRSGERYIIGGQKTTLATILKTLEDVSSVHGPRLHIPYVAALTYAWLSETMARRAGRETLVTVEGVRTMNNIFEICSDKAQRELSTRFRPLVDTLRDEVAWYRARQVSAKA